MSINGVIACGNPDTAAAGATLLAQGGNAVDAAVAATFASFIAESVLVNIGGGGIASLFDSHTGTASIYDFFSDMPSGPFTPQADFRRIEIDFGAEQQPFYIGRASVAVPGVVAGLCQMLAEHGRLSLAQCLAPAIQLARQGVALTEAMAYILYLLTPIFTDTPALAARYNPGGKTLQAGEYVILPELADTLTRLGQTGPDLFYTGAVAQAIVADQQANSGLVTAADLANYRVHKSQPIQIDYRGCQLLLPPLSSTGGVLIAFAFKLLQAIDLSQITPSSASHLRLLTEVMRLTNVARPTWDSSQGTAAERIACFLADDHVDTYRRQLHDILHGAAPPPEPDPIPGPSSTTHISVMDTDGLVVSVTNSAGENAGFIVGDTGVCLNNMLGEIDLHPNGFHQFPPATRLTTMMSPVIVLRNGKPVLALGSGGSNRIRSAIMQVISNVIDFDMSLADAIEAPRVHFEDGVLQAEGDITADTVQQLQQQGYTVNHWPSKSMFYGGAHAIAYQNGHLIPVGDARRGGSIATA